MKRRILLLFLLLLILPNYGLCKQQTKHALPVEVASSVDRDSVNIGDRIRYKIAVRTRKDVEVEFPGPGEDWSGFRVRDFGSKKSRPFFGRVTYSQWVLLDTYKTGKHSIPRLTIRYRLKDAHEWQETKTNEIAIEVKTLLDAEAEDIRDIKPPINFPARYTPYIIALLLIAGFLAGVFLKRNDAIEELSIPPRPAHLVAYEALERLKTKDLPAKGRIKEYYIELSAIIRQYLEARFFLRAPEMTTEEFLATVKDKEEISSGHKNALRDFLIHSDLVKFAKYGPSNKEIDLSFASAKKLIDQTKIE